MIELNHNFISLFYLFIIIGFVINNLIFQSNVWIYVLFTTIKFSFYLTKLYEQELDNKLELIY